MLAAHDFPTERESHTLWLRVSLFLLLLLAVCCRAPSEHRLGLAALAAPSTPRRPWNPAEPRRPTSLDELTLWLNVPAFRLNVLVAGRVERSYPVAVGATRYATPRGEFEITHVIWNPWWYPPKSEWARNEKVTPPGPSNPMGKVKLHMRGPYFLHGTPLPLSIGSPASHGCIRMLNEHAIALARLVQGAGGALVDDATTDSLAGPLYETREIELPRPIPFRITYDLAEVRHDTLFVYPDVYRTGRGTQRAHVLAALASAEYDTTRVDRVMLHRLLARATRRPQAVWVDSLIPMPIDPDMPRMP